MERLETRNRVEEALSALRRERRSLEELIGGGSLVGVSGEADSGKTHLVRLVLAQQARPDTLHVRVDLLDVYDEAHLIWLFARAAAAALLELTELSPGVTLTAGQELTIREDLRDAAPLALAEKPIEGVKLREVVTMIATIERFPRVRLWLDHLEGLIGRRNLDAREALWQIRTEEQAAPGLQIVISCRAEAVAIAADSQAAFYGDGQWLVLERPDGHIWERVAQAVGRPVNLGAIIELSGGHVPTAVALLARSDIEPRLAFAELIDANTGHARRCLAHARSLQRAGAILLASIAEGRSPYSELALSKRDVFLALNALKAAGLIRQPTPRRWALVDPVVASALRGGAVR